MGRKYCTVYDGKTCRSGYSSDSGEFRVIVFPADIEEKQRWLAKLSNILKSENVTKFMGICLRHWPKDFPYRIGPGGWPRPLEPPSEFGTTPASFSSQSVSQSRRIEERGNTFDQRASMSQALEVEENHDEINSWDEFCEFSRTLPFATEIDSEGVKILKISDSMFIEFLVIISKDFKVEAYRG